MVREEHFVFLTTCLCAHNNLSAAFLKALRDCIIEKAYSRNQFVLSQGHQQVYLWFIIKGFAREISASSIAPFTQTTWFWFPGDMICQNGFFIKKDSLVDIEIYRDSVVLEISDHAFRMLSEQFAETDLLAEQLRFIDYKNRKKYLSDLVMLKRLEHIRLIFSEHKSLFNTALHRDLASYFGIKSHNLTRYLKDLY